MHANFSEQHVNEVSIESLPPMRVACYRAVSSTPENDAGKYLEEWVDLQNIERPVRHFGFDVEVTPAQEKAGFRGYEVWVTVPADVQPSAGVTIRDFAGGLYAVMTLFNPFIDPFAFIPQGWKQLHEWVIGSSQYRSGEHQWMEELLRDGNDLKLYHPIVPAMVPAG